jgi:uncharacterized protein YbcI
MPFAAEVSICERRPCRIAARVVVPRWVSPSPSLRPEAASIAAPEVSLPVCPDHARIAETQTGWCAMTTIKDAPDQGLAIANEITRLHREFFGRGAASARTVFGRNIVMVVLEDVYTMGERTLIDDNNFEQVKENRQSFQMTMSARFIAAIERITGRTVAAFMSQVHQDPDLPVRGGLWIAPHSPLAQLASFAL